MMIGILAALLTPASAIAKTPFASDRITVTVEGKGSDVILIPGLGSSPRVWQELIAAVPGHRYHLVQLSGFAGQPTDGALNGPVAAPAAEEIARYIEEAGLKAPALIGHSMGGSMAMMVAGRHPGLVSKIMVVDMMPFMGAMFGPPGTTAESIKPMADAMLAQMKAADPAARRKQAEATISGMIRTEAMRPGAIEDSVKSDPDVSARAFHELIVTDLSADIARIAVPTTVLYVAPLGVPISDAQMDAYYAMAFTPLKGAVTKRIPDSAHFIMWDQPARFQSEVKAFLG
ncbi:alpha/beta fold hydrolase [Sphingobium boeckii]|uniref:Pimeloyl-ACP methyl ester carboxylesterase n=1 Tax=Sphingobium boeckii TaxID=1082345 RepID=A0A7W9ED51_9SPHN|nr:alpha/beta hydrolase [Sphingobium boeckii]MBB5684589.1 pimeloyl-ACP methyl ester carboxylesterase [Sphingobium boeckii]